MAFSDLTRASIVNVADRAKAMWTGAKTAVGFGWEALIGFFLNFLLSECKPQTEEARRRLIRSTAQRCSINGVDGCIECCMSAPRARKCRKKMAKKLKLKTKQQQDAHFHNVAMAANADLDEAVVGMSGAYDRDEGEDDEE